MIEVVEEAPGAVERQEEVLEEAEEDLGVEEEAGLKAGRRQS